MALGYWPIWASALSRIKVKGPVMRAKTEREIKLAIARTP